MATPYHGRSGVVYMSTSGAGTAAAVVQLSEWSLDRSTDTVDVTSFGDSNKVFVQGLPNLQGSISGFWDSDTDTLFDAAESSSAVKMYLYPASTAPSVYFFGTAWVSASISVGVNAAVAINGTFVAASSWSRKP